jgi:hypothetical protein
MGVNANKIKLCEQALAAKRAQLRTATDKDSLRRGIRALETRLAELRQDA